MKFVIGDRVHMYNWQTAAGIMRALGELNNTVYGINKACWEKWRKADDLTITGAKMALPGGSSYERYVIRSASLDDKCAYSWIIPGVCLYKK